MTTFVFPTLPGLTYDAPRTPVWHTEVEHSLSGKRSTLAYQAYPLIHFELEFSILRDDLAVSQLKQIVGLFNACKGQFDTFLYQDPDFNTFTSGNPQQFGTGDGTTTAFQLVAYYQNTGGPGYGEIIQNLATTPTIYLNGTAQATNNYVLGPSGTVTFNAAPANNAALTWTGSFYYRCAFDEDTLNTDKFMNQWWAIKKLPFTSVKL